MPAGSYTLIIGMYHSETGVRLEARGENQDLWPDNAITLTVVEVDQSVKE